MKHLRLLSSLLCAAACHVEPDTLEGSVSQSSVYENVTWEAAIASISDPLRTPQYGGLVLSEQAGLVPIGCDPQSGLWEFAHLRSGSVPARDAAGRFKMEANTGLVFVLIPGGTFLMGAQSADPSSPGYDADASEWEAPVRLVAVDPFFASKFEMTVGQWRRIRGEATPPEGAERPVVSVSWDECAEALPLVGLSLPTSAQWEYAARGSTQSPWWTGTTKQSLDGAENICDASVKGHVKNSRGEVYEKFEAWNDGYPHHAPVGSFRPNPFGLYDVHGNVFEWCRDEPELGIRNLRGGGSFVLAYFTRVSIEWSRESEFRGGHLGVRPTYEIAGPLEP